MLILIYHWVDTFSWGLLVHNGIIYPVVSGSVAMVTLTDFEYPVQAI